MLPQYQFSVFNRINYELIIIMISFFSFIFSQINWGMCSAPHNTQTFSKRSEVKWVIKAEISKNEKWYEKAKILFWIEWNAIKRASKGSTRLERT